MKCRNGQSRIDRIREESLACALRPVACILDYAQNQRSERWSRSPGAAHD